MSAAQRKLVLSVFSTFSVGGPQVRFARLANHFGDAYRHAIVAMDGRRDCAERLSSGLDVTFPQVPIRKGATLANVIAFRRCLRALRPHVLVTSNWGSIEWAIANRDGLVRQVHVEDGFGPEEAVRQLPRRALLRRLLLRRRLVALPSQTLFAIARDVWRLSPERLRYVPNGLDLDRFSPHGPGADLTVPGAGPLIGTVAVLRPEKNIARLLRAAALLRDQGVAFRLAVIGDGPERAQLEGLAGALGLTDRTTFPGHVADPAATYRAFDVFALSSDTEQMPFSLLEAMACGRAVAATDVGDVASMLPDQGRSQLAAPTDQALAAALRALLADGDLRAQLGAANRVKAEQDYDQQVMFAAWRSLLDGPPVARRE